MSTPASGPGPRDAVPEAGTASREKPHVDEGARGKPVQEASTAPNDVATEGANAHGHDQQPSGTGEQIDRESMYDRRPGEDKHRREGHP